MKTIVAFFKLIRWGNLFFIALSQYLFFNVVIQNIIPLATNTQGGNISAIKTSIFFIIASSVFIAAAGYIINDYFDIHIDSINKPEKNVVDKWVKRRWAILWHILFSFIGFLCCLIACYPTKNFILIMGNGISIILLWFYSTTFKKKLLIGNLIIAALSAWVILSVYIFYTGEMSISTKNTIFSLPMKSLLRWTIFYAGFAFITTIIREVVKDMEDREGDARFQCETIPIKWGIPAAKLYTAVWLFFCVGLLLLSQIFLWNNGKWIHSLYSAIFILFPLIIICRKLYAAVSTKDYHDVSNWLKFIMMTGIISMLFFNYFIYG